MLKNDTRFISRWDIPLALVLLTRLPIPRLPEPVFSRQARAAWAFPLVGLVVGLLGCAAAWLVLFAGLPPIVGAVVAVAVLIITTGAMHEDGLADTVDGFWGGFTPARRLEIMKDSHIGTYGVLALVLSQLLRVALVWTLLTAGDLGGILAACVLSRAVMPVLMTALPNARQSGLSHSVGAPTTAAALVSLGIALLLTFLLLGISTFWVILFGSILAFAIAIVAKTKIGGQTGDVLGASQVLSEIAILMVIAAQG